MQLHFLMLPLCDRISKIANKFFGGTTFENQMLSFGGDQLFNFLVMGKKELDDAGKKWVMAKLESTENMCHTHNFLLTLVHTNAPPNGTCLCVLHMFLCSSYA